MGHTNSVVQHSDGTVEYPPIHCLTDKTYYVDRPFVRPFAWNAYSVITHNYVCLVQILNKYFADLAM